MGGLSDLLATVGHAGLVGLDTMVLIYAFERHPAFGEAAREVLRAVEDGRCRACVSVLALGEVLTGAKRAQDPTLGLRYRDVFLRYPNLAMHDVDVAVMERLADLRAAYDLASPDAVHLATALVYGAGAFLTNDSRLKRVSEIEVVVLAQYSG